ncbi:uncharacterized protein F5891DRAFT_1192617 [Suillus fuscotomentosus]|uniref:Cyclin N-terminal domain-containing protein n=1 Tax=Suillus fuscotomentosus TaxID=1912939 RepID=A0AAD4E1U0_9AGAM|nr:uncharacterized protein F5891DRAFT_1192617 [Suillus fuscotomentosus]KAG1896733.1 hypothetical protein F5891DRAFT_1192617 [Suillus fuscotomentosus]
MSSDAPKTDIDKQTQHEAEVAAVLDVDVAPEADLDGDECGDLDAEDFDDPLMVSKYVVEIFKYMKQTEVEEIVAPSISHFLHCADSSYTESDILLAERYILKTINWNLSYLNPMHFLRRTRKSDDHNGETLEWRLLATPPSLLLLRRPGWDTSFSATINGAMGSGRAGVS